MLTSLLLRLTLVGAEWVLWILVLLSVISVALDRRPLYLLLCAAASTPMRWARNWKRRCRRATCRGAFDLVKGSEAIECVVIAAGLPALRRGATACGEAMLAAKARHAAGGRRPAIDPRDDRQQRPVRGAAGDGARHREGGPRSGGRRGRGAGDPNAVMAGVFEALVATAVGLFVAIPAVVAFNLLQRRVRTRWRTSIRSLTWCWRTFASKPASRCRARRRWRRPSAPGGSRLAGDG